MPAQFSRIRRFRFNLPQQIAAGMLVLFLLECCWLFTCLPDSSQNLWLRLLSLSCGVTLGGGLWWVTRRQFGNMGGYTALAFYCFTPEILRASMAANAEMLAALGVYGGIYTSIGVAHAMQGPRRKWRPRIVLLTVIFTVTATAHLAALAVVALVGLGLMLWIAEGRRRVVVPIVLGAATVALGLRWTWSGFLPLARFHAWMPFTGWLPTSLISAKDYFLRPENAGIAMATWIALAFYLSHRRSQYFGNTAPLVCAILLFLVQIDGSPWLWALPFLLTFMAGVFADAFEGARGRLAVGTAGCLVLLQGVVCWMGLFR